MLLLHHSHLVLLWHKIRRSIQIQVFLQLTWISESLFFVKSCIFIKTTVFKLHFQIWCILSWKKILILSKKKKRHMSVTLLLKWWGGRSGSYQCSKCKHRLPSYPVTWTLPAELSSHTKLCDLKFADCFFSRYSRTQTGTASCVDVIESLRTLNKVKNNRPRSILASKKHP